MANAPVKIFSISGTDWMKGFSRTTSSMIGGIFQLASGYDPFERPGIWQTPYMPQTLTGTALTTSVKFLTPFSEGGVGYIYAHSSTKLYRVTISNNTVADHTANITTGAVFGAKVWKDRYVYALTDTVKSIVLNAGTNTTLLTGLNAGVGHYMETGADSNLYVTDQASIAKLILQSGTTGNTLGVFNLETGMTARALINDGRYLIIIADNNSSGATNVSSKCVIMFWDMVKATADIIYYVDDKQMVGGGIIDGVVYVFGKDHIYACNSASPPQIVFSFLPDPVSGGVAVWPPANQGEIATRRGIIYWVGDSSDVIYALGNPFGRVKVLYAPYEGGGLNSAIGMGSNRLFTADSAGIYELQAGTGVRGSSLLSTSGVDLGKRYQFAFIKAVLDSELVSGQSLSFQVLSANDGRKISDTFSKSGTTDLGKQVLIFPRMPPSSETADGSQFEEISKINLSLTKTALKRFEMWAYPLEDNQWQS